MSEGAVWGIPTVGRGHTYFYALIFPVTRSFHFLVYSYFWISLIISLLGDTRINFSDRDKGYQPRHDANPFVPQQQGDNWWSCLKFPLIFELISSPTGAWSPSTWAALTHEKWFFYLDTCFAKQLLIVIFFLGGQSHGSHNKRPNSGNLQDSHHTYPKGKGGKKSPFEFLSFWLDWIATDLHSGVAHTLFPRIWETLRKFIFLVVCDQVPRSFRGPSVNMAIAADLQQIANTGSA